MYTVLQTQTLNDILCVFYLFLCSFGVGACLTNTFSPFCVCHSLHWDAIERSRGYLVYKFRVIVYSIGLFCKFVSVL